MISLTPDGGQRIPLRRLEFYRSFNRPYFWHAQPANWIEAAHVIESGADSWSIEDSEHGVLKDSLAVTSVGGSWNDLDSGRSRTMVLCDAEVPGATTRYHLFKDHQNLLELLNSAPLNETVLINEPETINAFDAFNSSEEFLVSGQQTPLSKYILQTGISDLEFVRRLIGQWNQSHDDQRMVLSYGQPWRIVGSWARDSVPNTALSIPDDPENVHVHGWGTLPSNSSHSVDACLISYQINTIFDMGRWNESKDQPLPHYLERSGKILTVGARRDIITPARGGSQEIQWRVELVTCANNWPIEDHPLCLDGFSPGYRMVSGLVESSDQKTVTVALDGCTPDPASVVCYLTTLSSGPQRVQGIHMPLYADARVMVAVPTGLYTSPPIFLCDIREADVAFPNPLIMFDGSNTPVQVQSPEIQILSPQGSVEVQSDSGSIKLTNNQVSFVLEGSEANVAAG